MADDMKSLLKDKSESAFQGKTEEITLKNRPIGDRATGAGDSDSQVVTIKKESKLGFTKSK